MNTKNSPDYTLFQDRNLDGVTFPRRMPARFSSEPEGEGLELCLRGLLVACLFAAMMICGAHLDTVAKTNDNRSALPDAHTAVAVARPVACPVAETL